MNALKVNFIKYFWFFSFLFVCFLFIVFVFCIIILKIKWLLIIYYLFSKKAKNSANIACLFLNVMNLLVDTQILAMKMDNSLPSLLIQSHFEI